MRRQTVFLKNAAILTVTSLLLRTVGIFFRVYLSNTIGAEGMGLYQLIVSVYVLGSTFATSGISTAVTRLIADEAACGTAQSVRRILRRSLLLSLLLGVASTALIYGGADLISLYWLRDIRAAAALRMLSFSLPSMGLSSCLRGYFLARRRVAGNSLAQLLEQGVRIGVIILLLNRYAGAGIGVACFAVMLGDVVAEWVSCGHLALGYWRDKRRLREELCGRSAPPVRGVVRRLLSIAAPITAGRYLNTALRTVENVLVPNSIAAYTGSREQGLSQFGALKGMALPLIFFPSSFLSAMSTLLIPEISEAGALQQQQKIKTAVSRTLHITLQSSLLIGMVFLIFSREWGLLFYGSTEVGIYLRVLAPLAPIMYTESMVDGILKGLNQQNHSLLYSVIDSASRIALIYFIVPRRGMGGFLFIMVVSNVLTSFLNVRRLLRVSGVTLQWSRWVLRPLTGAVLSGGIALAVVQAPFLSSVHGALKTVAGTVILCACYLGWLFLTRCITPAELHKITAK